RLPEALDNCEISIGINQDNAQAFCIRGAVLQSMGNYHDAISSCQTAIDLTKISGEGTKVVASASGKVIYADYDATFGNLVIIKLDNKNIVLSYAHLANLIVAKGASLNQGDIVGYVGHTGKVKQPQLHFAIREGKNAVDPLKFVSY
ncbi:MAG: hypothetical protein EBY20_11775, partial [Alphaproteobacteria bacterium]|nr:hypothetical protein [Alphaproteobacteria bacterium]